MRNKILLVLLLVLVVLTFSKAAYAADYSINSDTDLASLSPAAGSTIIVQSGTTLTISSSNTSALYDISIICESDVHLTIQNLNIISTAGTALAFSGGSNSLKIKGTNNLQSAAHCPGVKAENDTELTISGEGQLTARGGTMGAGIGGSENIGAVTDESLRISSGHINILSGTIIAYGGSYGAGIGGGEQGHGGYINISGGTVTAYGGATSAAGIGGGSGGKSGLITISGGTITAYGTNSGAAIGSGSSFRVEEITISGGTVNAYAGSSAAGIGGGYLSPGGIIKITGGTINARGGWQGAAIGSGHYADCGTIIIEGGDIKATLSSGTYSAAIGTGRYGRGGTIIIKGGTIYAQGGSYGGAAIGSGWNSSITETTYIQISGGTIDARAKYAAAIGGGRFVDNNGDIIITGGVISTYTSVSGYNDIGACQNTYSGRVLISGDAALFLQNNTSSEIVTSTHNYFDNETYVSGSAYGYDLIASWSGTAYAWLPTIDVMYAAGRGGSLSQRMLSSENSEKVLKGYSPKNAPAVTPDSGYSFVGWSNGSLTSTNLNNFKIYSPTTLTAVFEPINVTSVSLDIYDATLILGDSDILNDTIDLTETISPDDAADKSVTWKSSDNSIATVDKNGIVTAISEGAATITVETTDGGYTASCTITVIQLSTEIALDKYNIYLVKGSLDTLTSTITPSTTSDKGVTWSCDNPNVATFTVLSDNTIQITAQGAGTANITVTANDSGKSATCVVHVNNPDLGSSSKKANLTAQLVNESGAGVGGYSFTLYSDPISDITDSTGNVAFLNIAYDYHTLIIADSSGAEIRRYDLIFTLSSDNGYSLSGSDIRLNYTANTENIHLLFKINDTGDDITFEDVDFKVSNPVTGDRTSLWERIIEFIKGLFS